MVAVQVSFLFEDGKMHHVKPEIKEASRKLASDCYKDNPIRYEQWQFLNEEDTEV